MTNIIKIFIGTYSSPALGKWYELDTEAEEALEKWKELANGSSEPLISDNESDFNLQDEAHILYYIDMQEYLGDLESNEKISAQILLHHDRGYYTSSDLLKSGIQNSTLFEGSLDDYAYDQFKEMLQYYNLKDDIIDKIMPYVNTSDYGRDLDLNGDIIEHRIKRPDYGYDDYVLVRY